MPEQVTFAAQRRNIMGKAVRRLRREGLIPANVYGHNRESIPIQINALDFGRFLKTHGPTTILRLNLGDGAAGEMAVVRHVQHEPRTSDIQHVDFMHVEMTEPIHARIPIHIEGEAPAVKLTDGILLHLAEAVDVEALPTALPDAVTLDVSGLQAINDSLHVSDLHIPSGVKVLTDAAEPVVKIERPRVNVEGLEPGPEAVPTEGAPEPGVGTTL